MEVALPDGTQVPVTLRRNARARRMLLRIANHDGSVHLTLPPGVSMRRALKFAKDKAPWIAAKRAALPSAIPFEPGTCFPLRGKTTRIEHIGTGKSDIAHIDNSLKITGTSGAIAGLVRDWLRQCARADIRARVKEHALEVGRKPGVIGIGDARTRWASCSINGDMRFSWRLILAPPGVLDYVAAHETAHLRIRNHGPKFWALTGRLYPDVTAARKWLTDNGAELHRYG